METVLLVLALIGLVVAISTGIAVSIIVWRPVIDELRERKKAMKNLGEK